jgi:hypothetical protein
MSLRRLAAMPSNFTGIDGPVLSAPVHGNMHTLPYYFRNGFWKLAQLRSPQRVHSDLPSRPRQRGYVAAPRKWHELVGASGAAALAAAEETAEAPLEAKATAKAPQ